MPPFDDVVCSVFSASKDFVQRYRSFQKYPLYTECCVELLRIYMHTRSDFRDIRSFSHHVRMSLMLNGLRTRPLEAKGHRGRSCSVATMRSSLQFSFGRKQILGVGVSTIALRPDERFDERHLEAACKRVLSCCQKIPFSFYSYAIPDDNRLLFYIELEHTTGGEFSFEHVRLLQKELGVIVLEAVENVQSRVHMPSNEDETLRNCLLLSQEIREIQSPPQVMIQYHGQTESFILFHCIVVLLVEKSAAKKPCSFVPSGSIDSIQLIQVSQMESFNERYVKQALVLLLHLQKEPYLYTDRSINFHAARNSVVDWFSHLFGSFRDLNGGLIAYQRTLLSSIHAAVQNESGYDHRVCEKIFYSIMPPFAKNICAADQIVEMVRLFFSMRILPYGKRGEKVLRSKNANIFSSVFLKPKNLTSSMILHAAYSRGIKEHQCLLATDYIDDQEYYGVVLVTNEDNIRKEFESWVEEILDREKKDQRKRQQIRLVLPQPPLLLDPRVGTDLTTGIVIKLLYDGLYRLNEENIPVPAMAEKVLIKDGGCTYIFYIKEAVWSNFMPVTAHDFEYTWKKILDPSFFTIFAYLFDPIQNAREAKAGLVDSSKIGIFSLSDKELVVRLCHPAPYFLELCCHWMFSPLCKELDIKRPEWAHFADSYLVSNGPFSLSYWSPNGEMQLVKNSSFWNQEAISLQRIDIHVVEDVQKAMRFFNEGYIDWFGDPLHDVQKQVFDQSCEEIHRYPVNAIYWYEFDTSKPPFSSKKIRRAFSLAIHREKCKEEFLEKGFQIASSFLPRKLSQSSYSKYFEYDPDLACKLFEEGLAELSLTRKDLGVIQIIISKVSCNLELSTTIVRSWKQIFHIPIEIQLHGRAQFFEESQSGRVHIAGRRWCSWYYDPAYTFEMLRNEKNMVGVCRWHSEEFCTLVNRAQQEEDPALRKRLYAQAEAFVLEEMPVIPLYEYVYRYAKNPALHNVCCSYNGGVDFSYATLE